MASEIVVLLQTVVSRQTDPQVPTVVTVGSFHAGTKHNFIPDDARLQLTVRTMNSQQRGKVLAAISRITNGVAAAAGVPAERAPIIEIAPDHVPATISNPQLTRRVALHSNARLARQTSCPARTPANLLPCPNPPFERASKR